MFSTRGIRKQWLWLTVLKIHCMGVCKACGQLQKLQDTGHSIVQLQGKEEISMIVGYCLT